MEIHRSARKHAIDDETIAHAVDHAIVVVWLEFENGPPIVIHAMTLRRAFHCLLPTVEDD